MANLRSKIMLFCVGLSGAALATEYHVARQACSHASSIGSDSNSGLGRAAAFFTVQKCLNTILPGDTCWIHSGVYIDDSEIRAGLVATETSPTRILGASGDAAVLQGTTNQSNLDFNATSCNPSGPSQIGCDNFSVISVKSGDFGNAVRYLEIGNLILRTGNNSALFLPYADKVYLHDLFFDDQSRHRQFNPVQSALVVAPYMRNFFIERITVRNGGVPHTFNLFNIDIGLEGRVRMLDIEDMNGNTDTGHYTNKSIDYEFVRLRNWCPWTYDDGGARNTYNSAHAINRYFSAQESPIGCTGTPLLGWFNARRTKPDDCTPAPGQTSCYNAKIGQRGGLYNVNLTLEGIGQSSNDWAGLHHQQTRWNDPGHVPPYNYLLIADWRAYNNALDNLPNGIISMDEPTPPLGYESDCLRHEIAFNAYNIPSGSAVHNARVSATCRSAWSPGIGSVKRSNGFQAGYFQLSDHEPLLTSPLIDAGDNRTYGGTPLFPPPVGGGNRIDIGAHEYGAGAWPYEFQTISTVNTTTPRICWDLNTTKCDVILPLWDPSNIFQGDPSAPTISSRDSPLKYYWIQIDPSNSFHSGNSAVAQGFGPYFTYDNTFQPLASAIYSTSYDVPANANLLNGRDYYVQIRVGEQTWNGSESTGPGPWSLGFYRFRVDTGGATPTPTPSPSSPPTAVPSPSQTPASADTEAAVSDESATATSIISSGCAVGSTNDSVLLLLGLLVLWRSSKRRRVAEMLLSRVKASPHEDLG